MSEGWSVVGGQYGVENSEQVSVGYEVGHSGTEAGNPRITSVTKEIEGIGSDGAEEVIYFSAVRRCVAGD